MNFGTEILEKQKKKKINRNNSVKLQKILRKGVYSGV